MNESIDSAIEAEFGLLFRVLDPKDRMRARDLFTQLRSTSGDLCAQGFANENARADMAHEVDGGTAAGLSNKTLKLFTQWNELQHEILTLREDYAERYPGIVREMEKQQ